MFPSFIELKKNCKKVDESLPKARLVIMGDCATQHLATAIKGYGVNEGLCLDILDTDYNQILPQIIDPNSETYSFNPDYVLIAMCTEKLYEAYAETKIEDRSSFCDNKIKEIEGYLTGLRANSSAKILQLNFPEADDRAYGNFGAIYESSFISQLRKLNGALAKLAREIGNVYIIDASYIQNCMGREAFHDEKIYYAAKMPFSTEALPRIAALVIQEIKALRGQIKKCLVLDLDNTLWGGVVGDDGLNGIQIGELGIGHAFWSFQLWLKELTKRGIILAVCSKNDEDKAKEPFEKHPEMVLRLTDIAMFVANWEDKASNIRQIQNTLNIGMDSMVFIDDNPFERDLVSSMIPEITVPQMPSDPALYVSYLQSLNLFETTSASEQDKDRTNQYREQANRANLMKQFASYDEYLENLGMVGKAKAFDEFSYPRIAQLSQRSNQFNLRTVRYSEEDIKNIANNDSYVTRYFTLEDKLGDHGLISVLIMEKRDDALFIESLLMSCRVLKRGMEEFIFNAIIDAARENGVSKVIGEYIKTPKNSMVEHLYENMGFTNTGDNIYTMNVADYSYKKNYINKQS